MVSKGSPQVPEDQIIEALDSAQAYGTYSLDRTFDDAGEEGENSYLEKYTGFEELGYDRVELGEIIQKVMSTFNDQYKFIFRERFLNNKSQSAIAEELGVSQMTVSRAEKSMVEKFRAELRR